MDEPTNAVPSASRFPSILMLILGVCVPLTFHLRRLLRGHGFSLWLWPVVCLVSSITSVRSFPGMNAAVRAVVRMGIYAGAKVYFIYEVSVVPQSCIL